MDVIAYDLYSQVAGHVTYLGQLKAGTLAIYGPIHLWPLTCMPGPPLVLSLATLAFLSPSVVEHVHFAQLEPLLPVSAWLILSCLCTWLELSKILLFRPVPLSKEKNELETFFFFF